jgi:hypothetical protein
MRQEHHDPGEVSDGFHTFNELYEHRHLLFCLAIREDPAAWKSLQHYDEQPMYPGWFIAGTVLDGVDITYHLPLAYWNLCHAEELSYAMEWDGHTSQDVCARLRAFLQERG